MVVPFYFSIPSSILAKSTLKCYFFLYFVDSLCDYIIRLLELTKTSCFLEEQPDRKKKKRVKSIIVALSLVTSVGHMRR